LVAQERRCINPCQFSCACVQALTTRGFTEEHFATVVSFLHRIVQIAKRIQALPGHKMLKKFIPAALEDEELQQVKKEVNEFSKRFQMPGIKYV